PEPVRGNQSHLAIGKDRIPSTEELQHNGVEQQKDEKNIQKDKVEEKIEESAVKPRASMILKGNPEKMPFVDAARYILSIRTNVLLILASACGYFFFTGVRTFAIILLRGRF